MTITILLFGLCSVLFAGTTSASGYLRCNPPPPRPDSSYAPNQPWYRPGSSISYACNPGCVMRDSPTRTCRRLPDTTYGWYPTHPPFCHCRPTGHGHYTSRPHVYTTTTQPHHYPCSAPTAPQHGSLAPYSRRSSYYVGDTVTYQCESGYNMVGNAVATCSHRGWTPVPSCDPIHKCQRPENPSYGSISSLYAPKATYRDNEMLTYSCDPGYCMVGDPDVHCRQGSWSHTPRCVGGCKSRDAPQYGFSGDSRRHWCPGDRTSYQCRYGYRMVGDAQSTCGSNYKWNNAVPSCKKICGAATAPSYGVITSQAKSEYVEDQSYTFTCLRAYCRAGDSLVRCTHQGWSHSPQCNKGCGDRKAPSYGSYRGRNSGWCPGDRAQYQCNSGFRMEGQEYSTCGSTGQWNYAVPTCKKICRRPSNPQYGRVVSRPAGKSTYQEDDSVTYVCNRGYCLSGDTKAYCRHTGWTRAPVCRKACQHRNAPSYGSYYGSQTSWCPGQRARFRCDRSFRMVGQEYSRCQNDGSWESNVPACRKVCQRPDDPQYGNVVSTPRNKQRYDEDESVSYRCNNGYCMHGNSTAYCRHTGWTPGPQCLPGCKPRDPPSYGSYVRSHPSYCPGQRAQFQCDRHFRLRGNEYSSCGNGGQWDSDVPRCRRMCGAARRLQHGSTSSSKTSYSEGDYADYTCNPGYCLQGDARVHCRHSGWADLPTCRQQCPHRNPPNYGSYYGSNTRWCPGARARYRCDLTFRMVGREYSSCQDDGSWQYGVPSCRKVCQRPDDPQYGNVVSTPRNKQRYDEDESVSYRCNNGYCMNGNSTAYCRHTGWTPGPQCLPGCKPRDPPSYGSYVRSHPSYCPGQRAQFQCDRHFRLRGNEYSSCGNGGQWDSDVPRCRRVCGAAPRLQYGKASSNKASYMEGEYLNYQCNPGYCIYGNPRVDCRHSGFSGLPTCRKQCPHRNAPSYGSYVGAGTTWCPGRRARFQCDRTFRMVGQEYSRCEDDGSWQYNVPRCRKVCSPPESPRYGFAVGSPKTEYNEEESISYVCNPGYCMSGDATIHCRHTGWTNGPTCRPGCKPRDPPSYGSYVRSQPSYCPGQRAQFQCDRHFRLRGNEYSSCGNGGQWDSEIPRCRRVCGYPQPLSYGIVLSQNRTYLEGDRITYRCNPGFCLSGNRRVECRHNGWGPLPVCRAACTHRNAPSYGSYYGNKTSWCPGDRARFRCDQHFALEGQEYSTCGGDGAWSYGVPECNRRCQRRGNPQYGYVISTPRSQSVYNQGDHVTYGCNPGYCLAGDARVRCLHSGWSHSPTCQKGCSHRNGPSYGGIYGQKTSWCPGEKAGFFCDEHFRLYGRANATCQPDGSWNHDVPRCRRVCARPSNPSYGSISGSQSSYNEGDYVTYNCNQGYCLRGDPRAYCRHQGWSHAPACGRGCPGLHAPAYGTVNSSRSHYCPGDKVGFQCRDGYEMSGYASSTCQNSYSWNNRAPSCTKKCRKPSPPQHGYIVTSSRPRNSYSLDDHVTVGCNSGYCGGGSIYCRHGGWDNSVSCHHGCPSRNPPAHGSYSGSRRYWCAGDQASYTCAYGYEMYGSGVTTCNSTYGWDRDVPSCRKVCHLPQAPTHGRFHNSLPQKTSYYENEYVQVVCYDGYNLVGNSNVYCRSSGWADFPSCQHRPATHPPGYGNPPAGGSCKNKCGLLDSGGCSCSHKCVYQGNCCSDFQQFCGLYIGNPSLRSGQ